MMEERSCTSYLYPQGATTVTGGALTPCWHRDGTMRLAITEVVHPNDCHLRPASRWPAGAMSGRRRLADGGD